MRVGIVGPPGAGKSTLFHALTGKKPGVSGKMEMVIGVTPVPDERVKTLSDWFGSKKYTYTHIEYIDAPPLETGGLERESFRKEFLRGLELADALILILPCFPVFDTEKVKSSVREILNEFLLSDLELIENRLRRVQRDLQRGVAGDLVKEQELLQRGLAELESERPLLKLNLSEDEVKRLRSFAFLTMKPYLLTLNLAEADIQRGEELILSIQSFFPETAIVAASASLESEIADLNEEEIPLFLEAMGIKRLARESILSKTREMLNLITFFTANTEEARAWNLKRGTTALKAAGTVHTDMERGFIRAEVFNYNILAEHKTYAELRSAGILRLEGKDYIVQDGDVLLFRFSV